jgi:hypothetical protein
MGGINMSKTHTMNLRWLKTPCFYRPEIELQQAWIDLSTGEIEWRKILTESKTMAPFPPSNEKGIIFCDNIKCNSQNENGTCSSIPVQNKIDGCYGYIRPENKST